MLSTLRGRSRLVAGTPAGRVEVRDLPSPDLGHGHGGHRVLDEHSDAGVSALQMQRQLGLARYDTAWLILHKLRRAMVSPERVPLTEEVEVDECFVGGHEAGPRGGRARGTKALVAVSVGVRGTGSGRVRMSVINDASAVTLTGYVQDNIAAGTTVHTDAWKGYLPLAKFGDNNSHAARAPHADEATTPPRSCPGCTG